MAVAAVAATPTLAIYKVKTMEGAVARAAAVELVANPRDRRLKAKETTADFVRMSGVLASAEAEAAQEVPAALLMLRPAKEALAALAAQQSTLTRPGVHSALS